MRQFESVIAQSKYNISQLAQRSGISRSTISRITAGKVSPSLATLEELAWAMGLQLEVNFKPAGERAAAQAARWQLEGAAYTPADPAISRAWLDRFHRYGATTEIDIALLAGKLASPLHQADAVILPHGFDQTSLISAGDCSGESWALSGACGLQAAGIQVVGSNILYTQDLHLAQQTLQEFRTLPGRTILLPAAAASLQGQVAVGIARYVSPVQLLLDCLGLETNLAQAATAELRSWL